MFNLDQILKKVKPPRRKKSRAGKGARKPLNKKRLFIIGGATLGTGLLVAFASVLFIFAHFGRGLPDVFQLSNYEPPVMTRIHANDGSLMTEYATQKRLFVPINAVPPKLIDAFLAAEDKNFYDHYGVDIIGVFRSALINLSNAMSNRRPVGGSTITQQVAKNFLLTSETTYERKIKEAILAVRMERVFDKGQILELYMNDVYLGFGSYGVAAAALNYFDKSMEELNLPEMAYLAALLKAPSNYHPIRRPEAALARRNWVLGRMYDEDFITREEYNEALATPLEVNLSLKEELFRADYFEEEVRRELLAIYGQKNLYGGGMSVSTTLEPRLQAIAERVFRNGLVAYDMRHGWRGPLDRMTLDDGWAASLGEAKFSLGIDSWRLALVLGFSGNDALIGFEDGNLGIIPFEEVKWARRWRQGERLGGSVKAISDVLAPGDIIAVVTITGTRVALTREPGGLAFVEDAKRADPDGKAENYALRQIPEAEGALIAMDPHTGRVLAMVGGFDYGTSQFNRATQAKRQTGSAFKPIVYAAALDSGFTPSSLILDAPFVMDQGVGQAKWKPSNSSNMFYGPSTLRLGLEKSRNLMTVRLAQYLGPEKILEYAERFGVGDNMQPTLAAALGAAENTLMQMTTAYAMIINGGYEIKPSLIERIQDRRGRTLFRHDQRTCFGCDSKTWRGQELPTVPDERARVLEAKTSYQLVSLLEGVVRNGTGRKIRALGIPLGGKTGTTNDWKDAWFIGFSPDLVVGVYVGFDQPRSLGVNEEGSAIAVPIFKDFMEAALSGQSAIPFRIPSGIRLVRVNADTGLLARPGDRRVILEAFLPGTEPSGVQFVLDGQGFLRLDQALDEDTSGIY